MLSISASSCRAAAAPLVAKVARRSSTPYHVTLTNATTVLHRRRPFSTAPPSSALPLDKAAPPARPTAATEASADGGASFSQSPPPPPPSSGRGGGSSSNNDDTTPSRGAMWVGRLVGVLVGATLAVQMVTFVARKKRATEEREAARTFERPEGAPEVKETLDYRSNSMSTIFSSMLPALEQFDARADEFVERKMAAESRAADLAARRKRGPIPASETRDAETALVRVAAEERTLFQPRLAYLRELYRVRSLELMQRSQYNGERIVQARQVLADAAAAGAAASSSSPSAASGAIAAVGARSAPSAESVAEAEATLASLRAEQEDFQRVAQANQHLAAIANKYGLKGPASAQRMMRPTTEGGAGGGAPGSG